MAKRNNDEIKLITINPLNNSEESLVSVALLNALTVLGAENNELVKIPTRKELTKLLKHAKFENLAKALDEVNGIRVRPVPCIEACSVAGITYFNHPIAGKIPCLAYRDKTIDEHQFKLVNSGLGADTVIIEDTVFNEKLAIDCIQYQIILNSGTKEIFEDKELNCNDCDHLCFVDKKDVCLYDNTEIADTNKCCNKYCNCFNWKTPKGE